LPGERLRTRDVAFDPVVTQLFLNALDPEHAKPVTC
jgi:hypothetical protein